jgi:chain length determinant protein EpsF
MNFNQFLLILWARKVILLSTLVLVFLTTLSVSLILPKKYAAMVSIVVDSKSADPLTGMQMQAQLLPGYMATQVEIISSHAVALRVVENLHLTEIPLIKEQFFAATKGNGSIGDWLADSMLKNLDVKPSRESSIIQIGYDGNDPQFAATMANEFAKTYINTSLELKVEPAKRQHEWFEGQIQNLRKELEAAQQKLSLAQQKYRVLNVSNNGVDFEITQLMEISSQLASAKNQSYSNVHTQVSNEQSIDNQLSQMKESVLQSIKTDISRVNSKLAEISERYGRNHPQYQAAEAELRVLRTRMNEELGNTKKPSKEMAESNRLMVENDQKIIKELEQALEKQKQRILDLKQQKNELDVLANEVMNVQHAYDTTLQRASQIHLESQVDQSNIAVLNPALPPLKPTSPKVVLNLVLSIFLGTLLGTGFALLSEMLDRRVRTGDDIVEGLGLVLLSEIPEVQGNKKWFRLRFSNVKAV